MKDKELKSRLNKLFNKSISKARVCCVNDCDSEAINSHILQKNGTISEIETKGHVYGFKNDFIIHEVIDFKRTGVNKTYTFKGFCSKHDKEIFRPIEDFEIDYEDYKSQLLFIYRTILNEKRKKEVIIDFNNSIVHDDKLGSHIKTSYFTASNEGSRSALKDMKYYEDIVLSDFETDNQSFDFYLRYIGRQEVCLASFFTFETTRQIQDEIKRTGVTPDVWTEIFICFFPVADENVLLMGFLKSDAEKCEAYIKDIFDLEESALLKKISDFMLYRCEEWICSEQFYIEKIKDKESSIISIIREATKSIDEDKELEISLF